MHFHTDSIHLSCEKGIKLHDVISNSRCIWSNRECQRNLSDESNTFDSLVDLCDFNEIIVKSQMIEWEIFAEKQNTIYTYMQLEAHALYQFFSETSNLCLMIWSCKMILEHLHNYNGCAYGCLDSIVSGCWLVIYAVNGTSVTRHGANAADLLHA